MHHVENIQLQEVGTAVYTYLGPFADLSPEELKQRFGLLQSPTSAQIPYAPFLNKTLADSLDWVSRGAVNPIKNQGSCGSCWAFSTACNLEGAGFVTTGKLVSVSEQNIVDCDKDDDGCDGGLPSSALTWSAHNGGVASEQAYPYRGEDGSCRRSVEKIIHNKGYQQISKNEDQIAQALQAYGPLSIAVDANGFNGYHGGILQNPSCSKTQLNHAINIVGYGEQNIPYWKIRNSWGTDWGEAGYIRVYRGDCTCGVCSQVVTATGVTISGSPPSPTPPGPTPPGPPCHTCSWFSWCPAGEVCQYHSSYSGCCSSGPSPPSPPGPSPSPPGPSPCNTCEWNSDCPSGQDCYYPSDDATSGCCSSGPPGLGMQKEVTANAADIKISWKDCGGRATITSLVPSTVSLGVDTKIIGSGTNNVQVDSGTFRAQVKAYGWLPIADITGPLGPAKKIVLPLGVGSITVDAIPLPIKVGPTSISFGVDLSAHIPAELISSTAHVTATSSPGEEVLCVDISFGEALLQTIV